MKTHFADDATLARIEELERENADLREQLASEGKLREETADTLVRVIHRAEAAEARTAELQERLAMFEAITSGSQHMAVDRALTTPPSGLREGMLQAAVIAENLVSGHSLEIGEAIRAEAEKLSEGDARDAARYRWLRDNPAHARNVIMNAGFTSKLDAAIDAAMHRAAQEERK